MTEKFLDTPIKRYSSGMRLRLGFAVAAHLDPDILLVDEVLAVGDAEFQKKCLKTMDDLRSSGRTVLFVSHSMAAVENLCARAIWIDNGEIREDGPSRDVIKTYMSTFSDAQKGCGANLGNIDTRKGSGAIRLIGLEFLDSKGQSIGCIRSGDHIKIRLFFRVHKKIRDPHIGIEICTELGALLTASNTWATGYHIPHVSPGDGHIDLEIDFLNFLPGRYYLSLWAGHWGEFHDYIQNCVILDVEASDYYNSGRGIESRFGLVFLPCRWRSDNLPIG